MDTTLHIKIGFATNNIFFGWHDSKLYQLPYTANGRYYGLRLIKPKHTKGGWVYYRVRRKKVGMQKLMALCRSVNWNIDKPSELL